MKKGWERKTLKEIAEYTIGLTYSPSDVSEKGMIVLRSSNIQNGKIDLTDLVRVTKSVKPKLIVKTGDILMCSRNGSARLVGKTAVIPELDEEMTFGTFMTVVRSPFNPFLSYFFTSDDFRKQITRGENPSIKQVTQYMLDEVEINLPPLPEQQRIVSLLDETFAGLAQVHANAERNLVNAREVFEAISKETFESSKAGWNKHTLGDKDIIEIIDSDRGVNYPKKSDFHEDGYCLFLNTKNVRPDGFDFTNTMFITEKKDKTLGKGKLSRNDVVMTTRGTIGNLGVYTKDVPFENIRTNSGMLIFRPNTKRLLPEFLFEVLRSGTIKEQIAKNVSGAAQPQLPIKTLVNFTFHIPNSLEEQRAIVKRLDALAAETSRLEAVYQSKLEAVEELRKSVLGKAFEGELSIDN